FVEFHGFRVPAEAGVADGQAIHDHKGVRVVRAEHPAPPGDHLLVELCRLRVAAKCGVAGGQAGPTLSSLGTNFGLWPLLGKNVAMIQDARLSGRTDVAAVVERLLSISGEDALTIDRKNLPPVTTRLTARFMLLSNELPKLTDSSGALPGRMILL